MWKRKCPNPKNYNGCKNILTYSTKGNYLTAVNRNSVCKPCSLFGRKHTTDAILKMKKSHQGKILSEHHKQRIKETSNPYIRTEKHKEQLRKRWSGKNNPGFGSCQSGDKNHMFGTNFYEIWIKKYGKKIADEKWLNWKSKLNTPTGSLNPACRLDVREKMRKSALKRVKRDGAWGRPNYNPDACIAIEKYGKERGYNFQHAKNGGEYSYPTLPYFADGYDQKHNVWIEYYERAHDEPKRIKRDIERMNRIINTVKCKFIVLKERKDTGYDEYIYNSAITE